MIRWPFGSRSRGLGLPNERTGAADATAPVTAALAAGAPFAVAGAGAAATAARGTQLTFEEVATTGAAAVEVVGVAVGAAPMKTGTDTLASSPFAAWA